MGEKIAQASLIISTLRDAGYKNTSYAVAELVDNSIEAEAKNIDICIESGDQLVNQTTSERIQKIAVFDDGVGMEMVANSESYFRFRTNPSELDIRANAFFIGSETTQFIFT